MKTISIYLLLIIFCKSAFSQSVIISPGTTENPAMIDLKNDYQRGIKIPTMGTVERLGIQNPTNGFTVFDSDKKGLCSFYDKNWYCSVKDSIVDRQLQLTFASDSTADDNFGHAVAISSTTAIAGASNAEVNANTNQGAVYIYSYSTSSKTWTQTQKLIAADGAANDNFGASVALVGSYMIVGAPGASSNTGAAYIYKKISNVWTQEAKIIPSDGLTGDRFGVSVDFFVNGSSVPFALIASSGDDNPSPSLTNLGSAYLFSPVSSVWTFQQKFVETTGFNSDGFGMTVRFKDENTIVVAKPSADNGSTINDSNTGKVFTYRKAASTWSLVQTFSLFQNYDLGEDVAIDGDYMVVGYRFGARVYKYNTATNLWLTSPKTLSSPYGAVYFGASVTIDGDRILVRDTYYDYGVFFKLTNSSTNTWTAYQTVSFSGFCYHINAEGHISAMENGLFIGGEGEESCSSRPGRLVFGEYNNN